MIELRALELLCSRLCHDLVSPVGAIRNGVEILEECDDGGVGDGFRGEAIQLINHAAGQADGRLRMFRLAYGQAGRETASFSDARVAAQGWFGTGRTKLDWPLGAVPDSAARRRGVVKALLNTLVLADETLTHGGVVSVAGDEDRLTIIAEGRPGAVSEELRAALDGRTAAADLTPRAVHAYIAGVFLRAAQIGLAIDQQAGERVRFNLSWASAGSL